MDTVYRQVLSSKVKQNLILSCLSSVIPKRFCEGDGIITDIDSEDTGIALRTHTSQENSLKSQSLQVQIPKSSNDARLMPVVLRIFTEKGQLTRSCLSVILIFSTMDQNQRLNCKSFSAFSPMGNKKNRHIYVIQLVH